MKRDWDLIRELLIEIEERCGPDDVVSAGAIELKGHSQETILYHLALLAEARLIDADDVGSHDGADWFVRRLTWEGHDFLDAARSDTTWGRAKSVAAEKGSGLTFAVLKELLVRFARDVLLGGG